MATDYVNEVQKLYVAYFSRPADPAGLNFWVGQLQTFPSAYPEISAVFAASPEYRATYGGLDSRGIVAEVYDNLFGRPVEAAGLDYWADALNSGVLSLDNVVTQVAAGSLGNDRAIYNGKVAVSTAFTARLDTQAEQAAYSGTAANQIASNYVAEIRDLQSAATHIDPGQIDAAIAQIVGLQTGIHLDGFTVE